MTEEIKRQLRCRKAVEPVIEHSKEEHRMGRNYLAGREGDANNCMLAAAGYNLRCLLKWLDILLRFILVRLGTCILLRLALPG